MNLDPRGLDGVPAGTNRYLLSALVSLEEDLQPERRRSPAQLAGMDFLSYLNSRPRRKGRAAQPAVLLFDQFEEILTTAPRAVEEKKAFFREIGEALNAEHFWALFIIREDYLAAFAPYREYIPTHMSTTFRLDLLDLEGAKEVAEQLARKGGRSFPAVDKLIRDLSRVQVQQPDGSFVAEQGIHVEPVHLQVVGRRLWAAMPDDDLSIDEADVAKYAEVSKALAGYYSEAVKKIAGGDLAVERALREWVGERLIVGGVRSQVRQEATRSAGLENTLIEQLLGSYLVRTEQRAGSNWFELGHDRMVEPVLEDNRAWEEEHLHPLQVQARLWEQARRAPSMLLSAEALPEAGRWAQQNPTLLTREEQEYLSLSQKLRREEAEIRRRQRRYTTAVAAAAALATVAALVSLVLFGRAERASRQANDALRKSEYSKRAAAMSLVYLNQRERLNRSLQTQM
ncbi:MAG TPA: hypothetical protein PKW90_20755, partial [Myxococcota bacterium]|nr:hypothetical protein [Myxococcota bacterium]